MSMMLSDLKSARIEFLRRFFDGRIKPFSCEIENMDVFFEHKDDVSPSGITIEDAVMEYAHGSCHMLSIALAEEMGVNELMVFTDKSGMPVHSALYSGDNGFILDANGVHRLDDAKKYWECLAGYKLNYSLKTIQDLAFFCEPSEDEIEDALDAFTCIHSFIDSHFIKEAVKKMDNKFSTSELG